jgi:membrane protease YdiL (CAAX protease family)
VTRRWAIALAFGPSLAAGLVGVIWWALAAPSWTPRVSALPALAAGVATGLAILAAAELLERRLPSFRYVTRRTERALRRLALPRGWAAALALATSLGEELLFRGMLLDLIGLLPQALAFGLAHPAGRRGWSYPLFAAASGLALGGLVLATGRLLPAVAAHLVINGVGLLRTARSAPPPP